MTGEIIQIGHWEKPTSAPTEYRWSCDLQVWNTDTGVIGLVAGSETRDGEELGDRLRRIADELDQLAFFLTQQAEETLPSRDGACLAKVAIFESSRVQIQMHKKKIPSERQEEWLRERLDHAKGLVGS